MYQYVLFDLDGTLTDPKEGICKSVQYALHKSGIEESNLDRLEPFIGPPLLDSFKEFYQMNEEEAQEAIRDYRERFAVIGLYENEVYPGILQMLRTLKDKGCRLAVASSKPTYFVTKILKYFQLGEYFDVVVGSEMDGRRVQKEEVVQEALLQLYGWQESPELLLKEQGDEKKQETVMVGDRKFDVLGAKTAGIQSIAVAYGYGPMEELVQAEPNAIASTVMELTGLLLKKETKSFWEKKYEEMELKEKEKMPKRSLFRAIYMVVPFVIYYLVFQIVAAAGVSLIQNLNERVDEATLLWLQNNSRLMAVGISIIAMGIGALVLFMVFRSKEPIPEYLVHKKDKWSLFPTIIVLGAILALGLNFLMGELLTYFSTDSVQLQKASFDASTPFWAGVILYLFVSPIAEELVFRWLLFGRIKRAIPVSLAIVTSALFFGCYHGNLIQGIYAFLMGMVMALTYHWSKTFLIPLLFHMSANAAIYFSAMSSPKVRGVISSPITCAVYMIIAIVLLFWFKERVSDK